jgi:hypothetical protein
MAETPPKPPRRRRRLPWIIRNGIVAVFGALFAVLASYMLRKIGM